MGSNVSILWSLLFLFFQVWSGFVKSVCQWLVASLTVTVSAVGFTIATSLFGVCNYVKGF